ncbi:hypothetical protein LIA77_06257 [Sarocladium implicatum]|nr:hypothetical protein LIA77_06257 [Sarocladium implicatum]
MSSAFRFFWPPSYTRSDALLPPVAIEQTYRVFLAQGQPGGFLSLPELMEVSSILSRVREPPVFQLFGRFVVEEDTHHGKRRGPRRCHIVAFPKAPEEQFPDDLVDHGIGRLLALRDWPWRHR